MQMLRKDANQHVEKVGFFEWGLHDSTNFEHANMFKSVIDYMNVHCFHNYPADAGTAVPHR